MRNNFMFSSITNNSLPCQARIWDLPTRLFHWLLVGNLIIIWWSQRDSRYADIHVFSGYLFLGLLGFRLLWGMVGSRYANFRSFAFGWSAVWNYLKTLFTPQRQHFLGHNPAGSWAVLAMLGVGLLVSFTGILTLGSENRHGPLAGLFNFAQGEVFHQIHWVTAWVMLGLIGIHIAGVLVASRLHRENLTKAMITGFKMAPPEQVNVPRHGVVAIVMLGLGLVSGGGYFRGYVTQTDEHPYLPFVGPQLPANAVWRKECGDCHLAYHPALLPARSWQRTWGEQHKHFGEDLLLEEETLAELRSFALNNAADRALTKTAWKISRTTPASQSPLRITETPYWVARHSSIAAEVWQRAKVESKANCGACHFDAVQGTFEAAAMQLPK
jgi:cytochrome b